MKTDTHRCPTHDHHPFLIHPTSITLSSLASSSIPYLILIIIIILFSKYKGMPNSEWENLYVCNVDQSIDESSMDWLIDWFCNDKNNRYTCLINEWKKVDGRGCGSLLWIIVSLFLSEWMNEQDFVTEREKGRYREELLLEQREES